MDLLTRPMIRDRSRSCCDPTKFKVRRGAELVSRRGDTGNCSNNLVPKRAMDPGSQARPARHLLINLNRQAWHPSSSAIAGRGTRVGPSLHSSGAANTVRRPVVSYQWESRGVSSKLCHVAGHTNYALWHIVLGFLSSGFVQAKIVTLLAIVG